MKRFKTFLIEQNDPKINYATEWMSVPENQIIAIKEFGNMFGSDRTEYLLSISQGIMKVRSSDDDHLMPIIDGKRQNWWKIKNIADRLDDKSWWDKTHKSSGSAYYARIAAGVLLSNINHTYKVTVGGGSVARAGFVGSESENFWEWMGLSGIGVDYKDTKKIEKMIDDAHEKTGVSEKKIAELRPTLINPSQGIIKWMNIFLADATGNGFKYDSYLWKSDLADYYKWMIDAKKTVEGQKPNTADSILIDTELAKDKFWKTNAKEMGNSYIFLPEDGKEYIVRVLKDNKPVGKMIQLSMKKGLEEAQGGGTVDSLKALNWIETIDGKEVTFKVYPAKLTTIIANSLSEGFISFVKEIWTKVKGLISKLWSRAEKIADKIGRAFVSTGTVSKISSSIFKDLSKTVLGEEYLSESLELREIYQDLLIDSATAKKTSDTLNKKQSKLLKSIESNGGESLALYKQGSKTDIDFSDFSDKKFQERVLSMCVLNLVALTIIDNMIHSWTQTSTDKDKLYKEMLNMVLNTKVGNTVLPVVELYGDTKWHVYDRSNIGITIGKIKKWAMDQRTEIQQAKPMIINYYSSTKGLGEGLWNIAHFYYLKDVKMNEDETQFIPYYFKMTLRSQGLQPKLNSSLQSYIVRRNNSGVATITDKRIIFDEL